MLDDVTVIVKNLRIAILAMNKHLLLEYLVRIGRRSVE
jgi:hypothetical protein